MIAAQRSPADPSAQNTRMAGKLRNVAEKPEQQGDANFRVRACCKAALPGEDINMQAHLWTCPAMRHVHETRALTGFGIGRSSRIPGNAILRFGAHKMHDNSLIRNNYQATPENQPYFHRTGSTRCTKKAQTPVLQFMSL